MQKKEKRKGGRGGWKDRWMEDGRLEKKRKDKKKVGFDLHTKKD